MKDPSNHLGRKGHVGASAKALERRVNRPGDTRPRRVSTYGNPGKAVTETARTIERNKALIRTWFNDKGPTAKARLTLFAPAARDSGRVFRGADQKLVSPKTNVVVLRRKGRRYVLENAYPSDRTARQLKRESRKYLFRKSRPTRP